MANRYFLFVKKEYDKYSDFDAVDTKLDYFTSMYLSRDVVSAVRRARRLTDKVILRHGEDDQYATHESAVAFYRALFSHLAMKYWQPRVKSLELTEDIWNSPGVRYLEEMGRIHPIQGVSMRKMTVAMSRSTSGIFELPIRDMDIFPRSFIYEYCMLRWLLDEAKTYYGAYYEDFRHRLELNDQILERELNRIHEIVERGY